ncbi:cytochrome c-type biogenesis protein CcmH [Immundisolibacter sp.]|uniref:cytochrome c-type biogenesis protein n=1 Tax=Immundisolibacter sp. TaxID=1934948 RepID=UPI003564FC5C
MRGLWWVLVVLWLPCAWAETVSEDPRQRQVLEIAEQLRCAVCQNQSVAESQAELALDMRRTIAEQLAAGRSEAEIIAYFRDRYGDFVLMRPPAHGSGAPLWWAPLGLLALAGAGAFFYLRRRIGREGDA